MTPEIRYMFYALFVVFDIWTTVRKRFIGSYEYFIGVASQLSLMSLSVTNSITKESPFSINYKRECALLSGQTTPVAKLTSLDGSGSKSNGSI